MITLHELGYCFSGEQIFKGLSLSVKPNEFLTLIGPSGCGKSTILKLMAGILKSTAGQISVATEKIGYMSQKDLLLPWRNVCQNITLPFQIKKRPIDQAKVFSLMETFEILHLKDKFPAMLSGGQKQRVSLLRTFFAGGEVLLLDEPFAALDMISKQKLCTWLRKTVRDLKLTVVYVTHDINEATVLSDRIVVLDKKSSILKSFHLAKKKENIRFEDQYNEESICTAKEIYHLVNPSGTEI